MAFRYSSRTTSTPVTRMQTTAGSLALVGSAPTKDAPVVTRLREAGLSYLVRRTSASGPTCAHRTRRADGARRGGLTRNPWDLTRSAGGSSSGSAAAVAAGLAPLAVGTETDGSIVCPASFNGVVGIKPTVGLLPQDGIVPISHSQDSPGPSPLRSLRYAELLDALCDSDDLRRCAPPRGSGLTGVRIGALRSCFGAHAATDAVADEALQHLSRAGATVIDVTYPDDMGSLDDDETDRPAVRVQTWTERLPRRTPRPLSRTRSTRSSHSTARTRTPNSNGSDKSSSKRPTPHPTLTTRSTSKPEAAVFKPAVTTASTRCSPTHELDALVAPAFPPAGVIDLVIGDADVGGDITSAPSVAGYPILSLPMGFVHGLPVGLAITGTAHSEPTLIQIADVLESSLGLLDAGALNPPVVTQSASPACEVGVPLRTPIRTATDTPCTHPRPGRRSSPSAPRVTPGK